jgi:hypothetical protein
VRPSRLPVPRRRRRRRHRRRSRFPRSSSHGLSRDYSLNLFPHWFASGHCQSMCLTGCIGLPNFGKSSSGPGWEFGAVRVTRLRAIRASPTNAQNFGALYVVPPAARAVNVCGALAQLFHHRRR